MNSTPEAAWADLAAAVERWSGDPEEARALRGRLTDLPDLRGKASGTIESLRKLKKSPDQIFKQLSEVPAKKDGDDDPSAELTVSPVVLRLMAANEGQPWPWQREGDDNVLRSLFLGEVGSVRALGRRTAACALAVAPQAGSLEFLACAFGLKQREHWIPVAAQLAQTLAGPQAETIAGLELEAHVSAWKKDGPHSRRHLFVLAALTAALRGAKFGGKDASGWVEASDRNEDDFSALPLACAELAERHREGAAALEPLALRALEKALTKFPGELNYQHAEAARRVIEVFGEREIAWKVLLRDVATTDTGSAAERLFEAHRTLLWLRNRGDTAREAALLGGALAAAPSVVEATRYYVRAGEAVRAEATEWLPSLRGALGAIEQVVWDGSPPLAQAVAMVTALVLVRAPLAAQLDWPKAVAAAGAMWLEPSEGTVAQRGWVDLVGLAAGRGALFDYLLHRGELDGVRKSSLRPALVEDKPKPAKGTREGGADLYAARHTVGLARLLRARWQDSSSSDTGLRVDKHLTNQCATHIVRRLALADVGEAAQVLLAVLAADAPQRRASLVHAEKLEDELWKNVRDNLPSQLDRGPLREVLEALCTLERERTPERLAEEAQGYRDVTAQFAPLADVSARTDAAWSKLLAMRAAAPALSGEQPATPEQTRAWLMDHALGFAEACAASSIAIEAALDEALPDRALRASDVEAVRNASDDELITLEHPVLERPVLARWRAAVVALRRLAEPLPWFVEAALDELLSRFEQWLDVAARNQEARALLLERIETAMKDEDEKQLERVLHEAARIRVAGPGSPTHFELLDRPKLRAVSHFWLRRLRFDQNALLPRQSRSSGWSYYGPLVLAVLGAPLSTVQTNYLWQPLIGDPFAGTEPTHLDRWHLGASERFIVVSVLFLGVCLQGLWQDLRRRLAGLTTREMLLRAAPPLAVLFAMNYALALLLWWVVGDQLDPLRTTLLWGTLSLYLGLFLGLLAQGNRIDRDDVAGD